MKSLFAFIFGTIFGVTVAGNIVLFSAYEMIKDENIKLKEELDAEFNAHELIRDDYFKLKEELDAEKSKSKEEN